jgi:hypothetical protein
MVDIIMELEDAGEEVVEAGVTVPVPAVGGRGPGGVSVS